MADLGLMITKKPSIAIFGLENKRKCLSEKME
jgi:hypothetical protein